MQNGHHDFLTCDRPDCSACAAESIKPEVLIRLRRLHRLEQWMKQMEMPVEDLADLILMRLDSFIEKRIEAIAKRAVKRMFQKVKIYLPREET